MRKDQISVNSFPGRAMALAMQIDRVFLLRELFVALAMILLVSGLALAQTATTATPRAHTTTSQQAVATKGVIGGKARTIVGETRQFGSGKVRSWLRLDQNGNPTALGVTLSEEAILNMPKELPAGQAGVELSLPLPAEASSTAFNHVFLGWNPQGHEPEKIYDVGHFDFHFYMISEQERNGITAQGADLDKTTKRLAAEFTPDGYVFAPNSAVPKMGAHWVNPLSEELRGQPFSKTFLYGSYDGRLIFAEPMITRAFFESKTNLTQEIKVPAKYERHTYYPTKYSVNYDAASREYTIALEGLTLR